MSCDNLKGKWALLLGASSGFGAAVGRSLAKKGMNIIGVHMDRKAAMPAVETLIGELKGLGAEVHFFNINAADADKRAAVLDNVKKVIGGEGGVRVLLHSLAFGALKPLVAEEGTATITSAQMDMTADVMGHSLVYWVQDLLSRDLFEENGRVYAMTSSGGTRAFPSYGAVSAAKAILESHIRQLAVELAPFKITANAIRAGVTDTPALRKIPDNLRMIEVASDRNPSGRLTTPEDVGEAISVLAGPETYWITGNVIGVDGGEDIVA